MWPQLYEWIALFIKWFHVIAGIAWIGASFYFTWLDNSLSTPPKWKQDKGIKGDLWAVHGGGFYEIAKYRVGPETMPEQLYWFKWEAYTTWLTGVALMFWMYYLNAQAYLVDPRVMSLTSIQAVGLSLGLLLVGVLFYEGIVRFFTASNPWVVLTLMVAAGGLFLFIFTHLFSGRGALIHMGALIGSIMVNNVWLKIIPGQKKMVAQVAAGARVDPAPGIEGKRRSIHNNYFTLPVLFLMISNHYPMVYQHSYNWIIALLIMLSSVWIRHYFNLKHNGKHQPLVLISGILALFLLAVFVSYSSANKAISSSDFSKENNLQQDQISALNIIQRRCSSCHSTKPTDEVFTVAPSGVVLDSWQDIERWKDRIIVRAIANEDMPFLNKTDMTTNERIELNRYLSNNRDATHSSVHSQ